VPLHLAMSLPLAVATRAPLEALGVPLVVPGRALDVRNAGGPCGNPWYAAC